MRRAFHIPVVVILFSALVWWALKNRTVSRDVLKKNGPVSPPERVLSGPRAAPAMEAPSEPDREPSAKGPPVPTAEDGKTERRAYRLVLSSGRLELETAEDIRGDFHPRRGRTAWRPGMLCCRLLDAQQHVLAEETLPAPDYVCVVLDPNTPGQNGKPQPAALSPTGPVVFQVRMPKLESATQMKVYRIVGTQPPRLREEPPGQLLATIPLAQ